MKEKNSFVYGEQVIIIAGISSRVQTPIFIFDWRHQPITRKTDGNLREINHYYQSGDIRRDTIDKKIGHLLGFN